MADKVYKALMFDLDGTLVDSVKDIARAVNQVRKTRNLAVHNWTEFGDRVGWGLKRALELSLPEVKDKKELEKALEELLVHYRKDPTGQTMVYPGIPEVLAALKGRGFHLFVYTNKDEDTAKTIVETLFPESFDGIFGAMDGRAMKPDGEAASDVIKATGFSPEEILYIGDSEIDMQCARAGGMDALAVLWGYRSRDELAEFEKLAEIERADEILSFIS